MVAAVVAVVSLLVMAAVPALAQFEPQYPPGNDAFDRTWSRTDMPVKEGEVERTWMWGPWAFTEVLQEPYADSPGGMREVQYFDKARMEINDPDAEDDGLWYVTNGLLVVEMIEGKYQIGDEEFDESPSPADVQIVGDPGQEFGPTYASIQELGLRAEEALSEGALVNQTINEDGEIVADTHFDQYDVTAAERVQVPTIDHTVAGPFWEFMNSEGLVWEDGEYVTEDLFQNPFYATGYPITEAYWATVPVGGTDRDVLWQCFERRCLSYTPGNPEGFLVEAGNVGQHYWTWRYDQEPAAEYTVLFGSLNGSDVTGFAELTLDGDQLTVEINASGYTPETMHMQHIHGVDAPEGGSVCPNPTADTNDDGLISISEGGPFYGGVALPLFSDVDAEEYPMSDEGGAVSFENTYTLEDEVDLTQHTIVLHGLPVAGEYDASVPVACGLIVPADAATYAADALSPENEPDPVMSSASGDAWFWHDANGDVIYFMLQAFDLADATAAHIHQGAEGESGGVIVPLFMGEEETTYAVDGILSTGRITADDLTGALADMTLDDLVILFGTSDEPSDAYVNVHSDGYPSGVMRDQIYEFLV